MALSEQRSSRGLLAALLSDLGPGETWRPVPLPPRLRAMESLRQGHRRTHSSPGGPAKEEGEWHEMRRRTMSGPALPGDGVGEREPVESTAVYPAVEGVPTTAQPEQTARDPAVIATGAAAAVPQSFGTSFRQRDDTQGELVDHSPSPVFPMSTVPSPRPPDINSPSQRPVLSSPPYRPSPPELRITKPSLSPSDLELPTATTLFPVSSFDGRARGVHPFAAAQAARLPSGGVDTAGMFQGGKQSAPAPVSMPVPDKGKGRALGERPAEGRQQTPRRGYIGPGGIVSRLASKSSLRRLGPSNILPDPTSDPFARLPPTPISPPLLTPTSTTLLRPAPIGPTLITDTHRFASPTSRLPSPSPSRMSPGFARGTAPGAPLGGVDKEEGYVEIPRFKKRELNLNIVRTGGVWQRLAWIGLWIVWPFNALLGMFFDVNVIYTLVQCTIHPSLETNDGGSWAFATSAYAVCWAISTCAVWMGWEVYYEFWRRWRLPRPAIEPIYLSLPASLHLSLLSFPHFTFLAHIRLSPLHTPFARDIIPETAHSLVQLAPGLLPLVPRAAIAIVLLVAFSDPSANLQSPYGGTDWSNLRDTHFFQTDGALTAYAHGVLLAFAACVLFRLVIVLVSAAVLWSFSARPLGGIFASKPRISSPTTPRTPKKSRASIVPHDPSTTMSPRKDWLASENEFDWAWRERARSRVQDAFELCMIRRGTGSGSRIALGTPLPPSSPAPPRGEEVTTPTAPIGGGAPTRQPGSGSSITPQDTTPAEAIPKPMTADDFVRSLIAIAPSQSPKKSRSSTNFSTIPAPARPESTIDPLGTKRVSGPNLLTTPPPPPPPPPGFNSSGRPGLGTYSIAINSSTSSHDLFYTPAETPAAGRSRSSGLGGVQGGPPTSYRFQRGGNEDEEDDHDEKETSPTRRLDPGQKRDSAASDEVAGRKRGRGTRQVQIQLSRLDHVPSA
ncbi:hypothetical protein EHS25_006817 [Saitozyma podzolica]|uniref:Uncharacterized protein n=1 Tax=Saitozyma podzolica TaxID=1890683 RepID=A0A427XRJ6_9TREE|nr:hypothetical protein EHS25_006817 [Saitozyma podzolica]